jgi:hypothetical protein
VEHTESLARHHRTVREAVDAARPGTRHPKPCPNIIGF